jgi:NAD(P)-dependent dehydrogenase (short-subunit alcohol dehydrogenase family)
MVGVVGVGAVGVGAAGTGSRGGDRRRALVTGASRGVGRASAVALARAGFDVAIAARTAEEGQGFDVAHDGVRRALPGSVASTADLVRAEGRQALAVPVDLRDTEAVRGAAELVLEAWGGVDVLVNNAIYTGRGAQAPVLEASMDELADELAVDVLAPLALISLLVPGMVARGGGTVLDVTSAVAYVDPLEMGSYGVGYAVGKAGLFKVAGILAVELGDRGIRAYNVHPGFILTERMALHMAEVAGLDASRAAPPEVCGSVVAWLADDPSPAPPNGSLVEAQDLCAELGLVDGWPPPTGPASTGPASTGPASTGDRR